MEYAMPSWSYISLLPMLFQLQGAHPGQKISASRDEEVSISSYHVVEVVEYAQPPCSPAKRQGLR